MLNYFKGHKTCIHILYHSFDFVQQKKTKITMEQPYMLPILCSQYHSCWCPGDLSCQGIGRHGIDPPESEYSIFSNRRVGIPQEQGQNHADLCLCSFCHHATSSHVINYEWGTVWCYFGINFDTLCEIHAGELYKTSWYGYFSLIQFMKAQYISITFYHASPGDMEASLFLGLCTSVTPPAF